MQKTVIYGAGQLTKILLCEVEKNGLLDPAVLTVDEAYRQSDEAWGLPLLSFERIEESYSPAEYNMLIVCGSMATRSRERMYREAKAKGYRLLNYISPAANLENEITMGDNNLIFGGAEIGFDGVMGCNNIIRHKVYLGHDFRMGDHNVLSVGCTIGGFSRIGSRCFFGFSVTAGPQRTFGDDCLIGMGSVVTKDIESGSKALGNPARVVSRQTD